MADLDYDAIPYRGQPIGATAPASLALAAARFGGPRPALDGPLRVLELGCGDAANLLGLAFFHPDWRCVGLDASGRAIARAREAAEALELPNLRLEESELSSFAADEPFDVVIAHGLYSWVGPEDRAALRRLIRDALAPRGLAYVAFNALPGWGVRGRVRDALVRSGAATLEEARERLDDWIATIGEPTNQWNALLAEELTRARAAPDAYLAHEYLAPHNAAFWLGDVARDFEAEGLVYLGDADFATTGWVDPTLREHLAPAGSTIAREEQIDLLVYRQHRAALLAHERGEPAGPGLLDEAYLATAVRRRNDPFDPSPGVEEPFDGMRGHELRVRASLTKVALLLLADRYPEGLRLEEVIERARGLLARDGITPEPDGDARLRDALRTLFERGELELRLEAPRLRTEPTSRPEATALSRWEARHGLVLTTPLHGALPLEPVDREIVARLDGSRTVDQTVDAIVEAVSAGELELEGAPSGAARLRPLLEDRVRQTLTLLGWWGLVG
jgi:SAM-dependent methyltransferase